MSNRWFQYGKTVLAGAAGAAIFDLLNIPLAWMLGAMTAVLIMQNGLKKQAVVRTSWRNGSFMLIGYMIGSAFTADAASKLLVQMPSMLMTNIVLIVSCLLIGWIGAKWTGMSIESGMIGNIPGGLSQMIALSEEVEKADMTVVALMQTMRLITVIFIVPMLVVHGIVKMSEATTPSISTEVSGASLLTAQDWGVILFVLVLCLISARIAARLHVPTPYMLGPVLVVSIWSGTGMPVPALPGWLITLAQLLIGCHAGAGMKFDRKTSWRRLILFSAMSSIGVILISFATGYALTFLHPMSIETAFLSVAPGGMAEMGLTAAIVNADLAVVSSYQLFRILFILFAVPPFLRWLLVKRKFGAKQGQDVIPPG